MTAAPRRTAVRVLAAIMAVSAIGFGLFTAVFAFVGEGQRVHAFHNAMVASLLLVLTAPAAVASASSPVRSAGALMHLGVVGVAGLATMALSLTLDPFTLPFIVLIGVRWALRTREERQLPQGRPSPILLVLVLAAAVPLVAYALGQAELQRIDDTSEHAEFYHWVESSFYAGAVLLLGLLAALRPAAYRLTGWSAGVALAILGAASVALQGYASTFDAPWAWAAIAGGVTFVAAAEWERQRARR